MESKARKDEEKTKKTIDEIKERARKMSLSPSPEPVNNLSDDDAALLRLSVRSLTLFT